MNTLFKLSLTMLMATALASFTILIYLVFASDDPYNKYAVAEQSALVIIPLSIISLMLTIYTCDKEDSML